MTVRQKFYNDGDVGLRGGELDETRAKAALLSDGDLWCTDFEEDSGLTAKQKIYNDGSIKIIGELDEWGDVPFAASLSNNIIPWPNKGTGESFSRAGNATYTGPGTGLISIAGANIPRFELVDGYRAILLEPGGTNLIQYSHELGNAASGGWWSNIALTSVTANGMLAPDGNTVADGLVADANNTSHYIQGPLTAGIAVDDKVALTVFGKPGNKDWVQLRIRFYDAGDVYLNDNAAYFFDISTGTIGLTVEAGDVTIHDYLIEVAANGFYRIGMIVSNGDGNTAKFRAHVHSAHDNLDSTFPGDATTVNIWFWGADLKKQDFFDSHVPTSGSTASRTTESGYPLWTLPTGLFDATGTAIIWVRFGYSWDDMTNVMNSGILACRDHTNSLFKNRRQDPLRNFRSYDSFNEAYSPALDWSKDTWYKLVVKWGYLVGAQKKMRIGVDSGVGISWGAEQNFDGSYTLGANLRLGYSLFGPMWLRKLMIFDRVLSDTEINVLGSP